MVKRTVVALFLLSTYACSLSAENREYRVLNKTQYQHIVQSARHKVQKIITDLQVYRQKSRDDQIAFIVKELADTPYLHNNAMGEGDWQANASSYIGGAIHINQNPVYRLDGLDCQTFVQTSVALLHAMNLKQFDQTIVKIAYGADKTAPLSVHFYNRNHFVDGDLNPINQKNGLFEDVTSKGMLASYKAEAKATLNRKEWFAFKKNHLAETVNVLDEAQGKRMVKRFKALQQEMHDPRFISETINISYLPKNLLIQKNKQGQYQANKEIFAKIPTPAVAEIINDTNKWRIQGKKIKEVIGTELNVSHFGLLYRQRFTQGETIYHRITCAYNQKKHCEVTPIHCNQQQCDVLMFAHATNAYPQDFYWYQKTDGQFVCSKTQPPKGTSYTYCNRVEKKPFFAYLSDYQYGSYWYMNYPALLGVHIERLQ